jgi:hypothetical protein
MLKYQLLIFLYFYKINSNKMKRQREEHEIYLVYDLYYDIMLYTDIDYVKNLCLVNKKFMSICDSSDFWKHKINLDYPGILNPDEEDEYNMNTYESIKMSYEEANNKLNNMYILFSEQPWLLDFEPYKLKIIKIENDYLLTFNIYDEDDVVMMMSKNQVLKLLTIFIYYQCIRFYGNIK